MMLNTRWSLKNEVNSAVSDPLWSIENIRVQEGKFHIIRGTVPTRRDLRSKV